MQTISLANAALSALANLILLAGLPLVFYVVYHKWRFQRGLAEILQRVGLQLGELRYLGYTAALTLVSVAVFLLWSPPVEPFIREGSPQRWFVGLGLGGPSILMAFLYGVVKTGLSEEILFRGLIAGSLSRRLPLLWANLLQAILFLIPHVLVVVVMPEMWILLLAVLAGALFTGWVRIRSGSILGPWLIHATLNVATCLSVAVRTAN